MYDMEIGWLTGLYDHSPGLGEVTEASVLWTFLVVQHFSQ